MGYLLRTDAIIPMKGILLKVPGGAMLPVSGDQSLLSAAEAIAVAAHDAEVVDMEEVEGALALGDYLLMKPLGQARNHTKALIGAP